MTQTEKVKQAIQNGYKTIAAITDYTAILRPNIRRILGQGAHAGTFKREERGVYTLTTDTGEERVYIELGKAEDVLPRMVSEQRKFDMVFLDPAYFSRALVGGNRGIKKYDFIHSGQFADVMHCISKLMRSDDSHIYLMLSGAKTAYKDMQKYIFGCMEAGLQYVKEGKYQKTFQDGSHVTNVRGEEASAERLILFTKSGLARTGELSEINLNIKAIRPSISKSYSTQKSEELCDQLIKQSTFTGEVVADPCAGSGIMGLRAYLLQRHAVMVEAMQETINNYILPKFITI